MRSFDLAPLYRATVGYDRIADLMDRVLQKDVPQPTYPPYNIEKINDNAYRITIAVAGFAADEPERAYLHRGIATRAFELRFALADHVRVTGAAHADGMLHIELVRETPEALKPRRIEIARVGDIEAKAVEATTA